MWKWIAVLSVLFAGALSAETKVVAFSASSRVDSVNKKLVNEAAEYARQLGASVTLIDLADFPMPFYDGDLEAKSGLPEKAKQLRQLLIQSQAIFIASPEYNSSIPAILKNAIDWSSRNEQGQGSRDAFKGKKVLIMSASPGTGGGARCLVHLKAILDNVGATVIEDKISVPNAYTAFDSTGHLKDQMLKQKLQNSVKAAIN